MDAPELNSGTGCEQIHTVYQMLVNRRLDENVLTFGSKTKTYNYN